MGKAVRSTSKFRGKVVRSTSKFGLRKCNKREDCGDDSISLIPDEILVAILSLLTLKEAATTSILSRRWRYLWTYTTGSLNFDASKTLNELQNQTKSRSLEMVNYVNWVNQVLKLHQGLYIDEFRVCFDLDERYFSQVDRWVNFAIEKRVQRFELDLSNCFGFRLVSNPKYNFLSLEKLSSSFSSYKHLHSNSHILRPHGFAGLTSLCLKHVDVTEEVLEYFLSNCLLLERLSVEVSNCLINLKVAGPSLHLKYLQISYCPSLKNLEISAIHLVSFTYNGANISVLFNDVPLLSELSIGHEYVIYFIKEPHQHLSYFSQLETLKLDLRHEVFYRSEFPREFPELRNLKNLELKVKTWDYISLIRFTSLIKASPSLSIFKILLISERSPEHTMAILGKDYPFFYRRERKATNYPHQCLKVVELIGFIGYGSDVDLALHLSEIAVSLEKMTINSCHPCSLGCPEEFEDDKGRWAARKRAEKLRTKLPPGAILEIV